MTQTEWSPSAQLQEDLKRAVESASATRRPILHHLNADTTWLLQIPRPAGAVKRGARFYYNILIDPWLTGGQSDVASWFSQQFHATPSAVQSIHEIDQLAQRAELMASASDDMEKEFEEDTLIDAVAVSHEFTDHCHKDTLLEIHPDVPVFAIKEAATLISSWKHFRTVVVVTAFGEGGDKDWRSTSIPPLPEWIGISRLLQTDDVLNYHAALLFTFNNRHANSQAKVKAISSQQSTRRKRDHHAVIEADEDDETAEAIVYTPHGMHSADLELIPSASPSISTLAFLHGLHNVRVGTAGGRTALQSNLGAHNGLQAQRILQADYWISTHDEIKKGGGLVAWFLQRDVLTVKDALERERRLQQKGVPPNGQLGELVETLDETECNYVDLGNGESRVLT